MACGTCGSGRCGGGNRCCGPTAGTGRRGARSLLKFSAYVTALAASFSFLLSDNQISVAAGALVAGPQYPAAAPRTLKNLSVRLGTVLPAGQVTVQLLKNGSPVTGFSAVFPAGSTAGMIVNTTTASVDIAQGDTFALRASGDASISALTLDLAATIGVN